VCSNTIPDTVTLKAVCCSPACGVTYQNRVRAQAKREQVIVDRKPCEHCQGPIPDSRRADSIYCSWRCKHNAISQEQRRTSPGYMRRYNYGMTETQYLRMLEQQGHACFICGTDDWGGKHDSPHVDHDHATGAVRGLLCGNCNNGLGHFKDNPARLRAAAEYLERSRDPG
jgi:Recombination endonuclease VII